MAELTFWRVLKSNLKCAFCKERKCPVRFFPERKLRVYFGGSYWVTKCKYDEAKEGEER